MRKFNKGQVGPRRALSVTVPVSPRVRRLVRPLPLAASALAPILALTLVSAYREYSRTIEQRLAGGQFSDTVNLFAAGERISANQRRSVSEIVALARESGSWTRLRPGGIEIYSPSGSPTTVLVNKGRIEGITSGGRSLDEFEFPPRLIANVSGRERRRLVRFAEIPKPLIAAIVSAEDKRFFEHVGFDPIRVIKAAYVDLKQGRKEQGASTLSMQLARSLWLQPEKSFRRKMNELALALMLEHKFTKEQIFEYYANQIYLGHRGSFSIHGIGEGAAAYFGKQIADLTVAESATLGGLIQRPGYYNPNREPARLVERRNVVLTLMQRNGYITSTQFQQASGAPLGIQGKGVPSSTVAPYFVDLASAEIQQLLSGSRILGQRVYTSLDPQLQRLADEAVTKGMRHVDALLRHRREKDRAQAALVVLDPHTGEVLALAGGRDYDETELNRARSKRQPGSVFKPFVYAAALSSAVTGGREVMTPESEVVDEPTTFWFHNKPYEPDNFGHSFSGTVTLRRALQKSLNVATVKVAQKTGYENVTALARKAGFSSVEATPSLALGAYEATPIEVASAYTVFANAGQRLEPTLISRIVDAAGRVIYSRPTGSRPVLDPRIAYQMVNLLEGVIESGTATRVRAMGFSAPAAGKTGTSRDGWFAGFTSNLLCVVWVGFDDNRDLGLEGSKSALPIWTHFMKGATALPRYANPEPFKRPQGLVTVAVDRETGLLATSLCESVRRETVLAGAEPTRYCNRHVRAKREPEQEPPASEEPAMEEPEPEEPEPEPVSIQEPPAPEPDPGPSGHIEPEPHQTEP